MYQAKVRKHIKINSNINERHVMQIALLAVFILSVPVHLIINSGVFLGVLIVLFTIGVLYKHVEIMFTPENPENLNYKYGGEGRVE